MGRHWHVGEVVSLAGTQAGTLSGAFVTADPPSKGVEIVSRRATETGREHCQGKRVVVALTLKPLIEEMPPQLGLPLQETVRGRGV